MLGTAITSGVSQPANVLRGGPRKRSVRVGPGSCARERRELPTRGLVRRKIGIDLELLERDVAHRRQGGHGREAADLDVVNGAAYSRINAGDANWTSSSSRTLKSNLNVVEPGDVLRKMAGIQVHTYAVQQLKAHNDELTERLSDMEARLTGEAAQE